MSDGNSGLHHSAKYKADVQKDASEAATLQISGTPTFVLAKSAKDKLDGVRIVGAQPFASFDAAIQQLLKQSAVAPNGKSNHDMTGKGK